MTPSKHLILIVDDEALIRHSLAKALQADTRLTTLEAQDGQTALTLLKPYEKGWGPFKTTSIACILLDHHMPGMDGLAFVTELTKLGHLYKTVPIILFSGTGDAEIHAQFATRCKLVQTLPKTASIDTVKATIYTTLRIT